MSQAILAIALVSGAFVRADECVAPSRFGVELGLGFEQRLSGSRPSSGTRLGMFHAQVLTRIGHARASQSERLELVNEVELIESLRPVRRFIVGDSELFRYTFGSTGRWRIFADAGAGISSSALHSPDIQQLNGWLQYQLQAGIGVKRRFRRSTGLVEYRLTHFSNHNTMEPNPGLNLHTLIVGMNF